MAYDDIINRAATQYGLDPNTLRRFMQIESGGNPNASSGSYRGLFQLSPTEFNKYGGGNIYDPNDNVNAAARKLKAEGDAFAEKYGRQPSASDLYLQHQQGVGGAEAHMSNLSAPAWQNMASTGEGRQKGEGWARKAIWGNIPDNPSTSPQFNKAMFPGGVDSVTSQNFIDGWKAKIEGGEMPSTAAKAMAADLRKRFSGNGTEATAGTTSAPQMATQQTVGNGERSSASYKRLAEALLRDGQKQLERPTHWAQPLAAIVNSGLAGYYGSKADEKEAATAASIAAAGDNSQLAKALLSSGNPDYVTAGIQLAAKENGPKELPEIVTVPGGVNVYGQKQPDKQFVFDKKTGRTIPISDWLTTSGGLPAAPSAPVATPQENPDAQTIPGIPSGTPQTAPQAQSGYREVPINVNTLPKPAEGLVYELGPNGHPMFDANNIPKMISKARDEAINRTPPVTMLKGPYGAEDPRIWDIEKKALVPAVLETQTATSPVAPSAPSPATATPEAAETAVPDIFDIFGVRPSATAVEAPAIVPADSGDTTPATPVAAPLPSNVVVGDAVQNAPEGYVHKLAPDGAGYLWKVGEDGKRLPFFEPKSEVDARSKQSELQRRAKAAGLEPGTTAYQDFMLRGGDKPLTATDKKAVLEAEDMLFTNKNVIEVLDKALELNDKAYSGPLASTRGYISSQLGSEAGDATQMLENMVQTQAINQLKAIFGGMPTEGERKILLELQGSVSQTPAVRADIWSRAKAMAESRLRLNEDRVNQIRGGTYFKSGGGQSGAASEMRELPRAAIEPGHTEGGYRFKGGDPARPESWEKM